MEINTINIETFCTISGVSFSDRVTLSKIHGKKIEKKYSEWYEIVSKNFTVPKNLCSLIEKKSKPEVKEKEVVKNTSKTKSNEKSSK